MSPTIDPQGSALASSIVLTWVTTMDMFCPNEKAGLRAVPAPPLLMGPKISMSYCVTGRSPDVKMLILSNCVINNAFYEYKRPLDNYR